MAPDFVKGRLRVFSLNALVPHRIGQPSIARSPSHVTHFPSFRIHTLYLSCPPSIPAAANHALSDCHAMNARPRTALAQAVVPLAASEKLTEGLLLQLLAGAVQVRRSTGNKKRKNGWNDR